MVLKRLDDKAITIASFSNNIISFIIHLQVAVVNRN